MDRLSKIQARCEAATPGPWKADYNTPFSDDFVGIYEETEGYIVKAEDEDEGYSTRPEDAAFIAHAREDIPYLLAEVERLQAQLAASQRREQAAVADMREAALEQTGIGLCVICKWGPEETFDGPHCGKCTMGNCKFEWRGPQGAGRGEAE